MNPRDLEVVDYELCDYELCKDLTWMLCVLVVVIVIVVFADTSFWSRGERYNGCARRVVLCDRRPPWRTHRHRARAWQRYAGRDRGEQKEEYVDLVMAHRIAEQFHAFMDGLRDALAQDPLRVFDDHELEKYDVMWLLLP